MKHFNIVRLFSTAAAIASLHAAAFAAEVPATLDTFEDANLNSLGIARMFLDDSTAGGQTTVSQTIADGVLTNKGLIAPPRGQPGWASMVLMLNPDGSAADLSQYEGIRIKVRQEKGMLSVSANSTDVTNYDYHAAIVPYQKGKDLHEVRIPFSEMRRAWSEQTKLDPSTVQSISLVAVNMQKGEYAYAIDEIGFY